MKRSGRQAAGEHAAGEEVRPADDARCTPGCRAPLRIFKVLQMGGSVERVLLPDGENGTIRERPGKAATSDAHVDILAKSLALGGAVIIVEEEDVVAKAHIFTRSRLLRHWLTLSARAVRGSRPESQRRRTP